MDIYSPVVTGSGAYVVHQNLAEHIPGYRIKPIDPRLGLFTPAMLPYRRNADIVHTAPDMGPFLLPKKSCCVLTFHNYYCDPQYLADTTLLRRLYYQTSLNANIEASVKRARCIVAVSAATADLVMANVNTRLPCHVIPNGVNTLRFRPADSAAVRRPDEKVKVLFAGNPSVRKGSNELMAISRVLPENTVLQITGGLRDTVDTRFSNPNIEYLPSVPYEQMPGVYQGADILFFPSLREGLSLVLLEAMASGLPVVTTNVSSMPELIEHGRGGFLYRPGDTLQAARYIEQLAVDDAMRREMGEYNREKIVMGYSVETMVAAYYQLFESLL